MGKELRRLRSLGWYEFYSSLPFLAHVPQRPGGDGAQVEPDRFRRTTEGNGPRAPTFDASGLQAISINEASHIYQTICRSTSYAMGAPSFESGSVLAASQLPRPRRLPQPPGSRSGLRSASPSFRSHA